MLLPNLSRKGLLQWVFPRKLTRTVKIRAFIIFSVCLFVGLYIPPKLTITLTDSVKHRIFWMVGMPRKGEIEKGDYLLFNKDHPFKKKYRGITRLVKEVGCVAGDILTQQGAEYFCNGVSMGIALPTDSAGNRLPHLAFHGVVPPGMYFMQGHDVRSYDSKYFGFITRQCVIAKVIPLI